MLYRYFDVPYPVRFMSPDFTSASWMPDTSEAHCLTDTLQEANVITIGSENEAVAPSCLLTPSVTDITSSIVGLSGSVVDCLRSRIRKFSNTIT